SPSSPSPSPSPSSPPSPSSSPPSAAAAASLLARYAIPVEVQHDMGLWNDYLQNSTWWRAEGILNYCFYGFTLVVAAHSIVRAVRDRTIFNLNKVVLYFCSISFILVSIIVREGNWHSNTGDTILYLCWPIGIVTYSLVVVKWARIMQLVDPRRYLHLVLLVISVAASLNFIASMVMYIVGLYVRNPHIYVTGHHMFTLGHPCFFFLQAVWTLYLAIVYSRRLRVVRLPDKVRLLLTRMTHVLYIMFFGFLAYSMAALLVGVNLTIDSLHGFMAKNLLYNAGTTVLFAGIFLVLNAQSNIRTSNQCKSGTWQLKSSNRIPGSGSGTAGTAGTVGASASNGQRNGQRNGGGGGGGSGGGSGSGGRHRDELLEDNIYYCEPSVLAPEKDLMAALRRSDHYQAADYYQVSSPTQTSFGG
ncbi:hypothetical protein GQ42DRAFT_21476, partial [Ramicandelaber brevisporus]